MKVSFKLNEEQRERLNNFKTRVKYRTGQAIAWTVDHAEIVVPIVLAAIPAGAKIIHSTNRARAEAIEQKRRDVDWYDPVAGEHVITKRKLTPKEKCEVARRRREGETVTEILYDMGLIKR